jgi:hypothetical protein
MASEQVSSGSAITICIFQFAEEWNWKCEAYSLDWYKSEYRNVEMMKAMQRNFQLRGQI